MGAAKKLSPQQQGDSQTWLLGKTSASPRARRDPRRRSSIRSYRRTGTTSRPICFHQPNLRQDSRIAHQGHKALLRRAQGPCVQVSLGDLKQNEDDAYRKIRLRIEDVQGKQVLCNFWGMDFTTDKLRSLVRKWQSLIESNVDVKTTDGYVLRCFCIGFTKKRQFQIRKTSYVQSAQIRAIRKKMVDIMTKEVASCDLIKAVEKFVPEFIGKDIMKACEGIYPL